MLFDWLKLVRALNCGLASAAIWVGAYLTGGYSLSWDSVATMIGAFAICAAGNVVNDIMDVDTDRINHPNRVLPSGRISLTKAKRAAATLHVLPLVLAATVNLWVTGLAVLSMLLLLAYNLRLKKIPLVGNFVVALLSGITFICGGLAVNPSGAFAFPGPWPAVVFAFFMHLAREIIKDVEDIPGDRPAGVRTFPQLAGVPSALGIIFLLFLALAFLTLIPLWRGWYGLRYAIIVIYFIDFPLLLLLLSAWLKPSAALIRCSRVGLKAGMVLGLIALVVA